MANLCKIPVVWQGQTGLPGVSIFFCDAAVSTAVAALVTFFNGIKSLFPTATSWTVPGAGDTIETDHGTLNGTWTMTGSGTVAGTGGAVAFATGVGCRVRWGTTGITNGRRVRGSTFLTGLISTAYDATGKVSAASVTSLQTAANGILADGSFRVYSREYFFDPDHPDIPARLGKASAYTTATVLNPVTSLRSRRV